MGQNRTIRLEIELKLDDDGTRFRDPKNKLQKIAAAIENAATEAYENTEATPGLREVSVQYALNHVVTRGNGGFVYEDESAEEA